MRKLLPILLALVVGCQNGSRQFDCSSNCGDREVVKECPRQVEECPPPSRQKQSPPPIETPKASSAPACKQQDITIKIPPQKIYVQQEAAAAQGAMPQPQGVAPQMMAMQPQQPMMLVPVAQGQSAPAGRSRPGVTIDYFRMPIPFLRLIAVPEAPPMMQAVQMVPMQQAMVPMQQAMMPMQQAVMPMQQAMMPMPQAAAPTHMTVPVQGTMPVQGMMQVPVQGTMPVQGQMTVPINGQMPVQTLMPPAPSAQGALPPNINWDQVEQMCDLLRELRARERAQQQKNP